MASVLICDERRGIRQGLVRALTALPGFAPVNTAASGEELLWRYPHERPDLVIIGTQRAVDSGIDTVRRLSVAHADAAILVFGAADDQNALTAAMACGARGFLSWDASSLEVCAALAQTLVVGDGRPEPTRPNADVEFTDRELQVLQGMSEGKSNLEIGRDLFLSEDTVKTHARRLFRKLGVQHRAQAVAYGFRCGLVR